VSHAQPPQVANVIFCNFLRILSSPTFFVLYCTPPVLLRASSTIIHLHRTHFAMSANTKYQPAPQRDSLDSPAYTQAPPSYQAETSQNPGLFAAPRGEDDNVPDDFKVSSTFSSACSRPPTNTPCSSAAPSPKPPSTSAWPSSAKSTASSPSNSR
jgi:hypothetical protein